MIMKLKKWPGPRGAVEPVKKTPVKFWKQLTAFL
jgi:hypothetical protein